MGNSQSQSVKQTLSVINSAVTNVTTDTKTSGNAITKQFNSYKVTAKGTKGCDILITQVNNSNQEIKVSSTVTNLNKLRSQLTSALQSKVKNESESTQGALAFGLNIQDTNQSIDQAISNYVTTNITSSTINSVSGYVSQLNNAELYLEDIDCTAGGKIEMSQSNVSKQIVSLIAKSLTENSQATEIANRMEAESEAAQSSKQIGIIDSLTNLLGGGIFAAILMTLCPCITLICCCLICCGGGGGSSSTKETIIQAPAAAVAPVTKAAAAFGKKLKKHLKLIKKMNF